MNELKEIKHTEIHIRKNEFRCIRNILNREQLYKGDPILLMYVASHDGKTQSEIAKELCIKPASLTVMVKRMEQAGLIVRKADEKDMRITRVFISETGKETSRKTARLFEEVVEQIYQEADFLLDLHGGDVNEAMTPLVFYPATAAPEVTAQAREAAQHLEVLYRIPSTAQNGLYSYAAQCGIPALLMEVGGMGLWTEEQVELELRSIQSLMGYLDMGPTPVKNSRQQETMEMCYTEADTPGLWFPEVKAEQLISAGQMLGRIEDLEGRILQTIHARWDGMALYHTVSLGVTTGDALVAYGKIG